MPAPERVEIGSEVLVPWGKDQYVAGTVTDIWNDHDEHVRVKIEFSEDSGITILLRRETLEAAGASA